MTLDNIRKKLDRLREIEFLTKEQQKFLHSIMLETEFYMINDMVNDLKNKE